ASARRRARHARGRRGLDAARLFPRGGPLGAADRRRRALLLWRRGRAAVARAWWGAARARGVFAGRGDDAAPARAAGPPAAVSGGARARRRGRPAHAADRARRAATDLAVGSASADGRKGVARSRDR